MNRASSIPMSVLHLVLDKGLTPVWNLNFFFNSKMSQLKVQCVSRTIYFVVVVVGKMNRCKGVINHCCFSIEYWETGDIHSRLPRQSTAKGSNIGPTKVKARKSIHWRYPWSWNKMLFVSKRLMTEILMNTIFKTNKFLSCHCNQILVTFLNPYLATVKILCATIYHFIIRDSRPGSQFVFYDFIKITATI